MTTANLLLQIIAYEKSTSGQTAIPNGSDSPAENFQVGIWLVAAPPHL